MRRSPPRHPAGGERVEELGLTVAGEEGLVCEVSIILGQRGNALVEERRGQRVRAVRGHGTVLVEGRTELGMRDGGL